MRYWYPIKMSDQERTENSNVAMNNINLKEQVCSSRQSNCKLTEILSADFKRSPL